MEQYDVKWFLLYGDYCSYNYRLQLLLNNKQQFCLITIQNMIQLKTILIYFHIVGIWHKIRQTSQFPLGKREERGYLGGEYFYPNLLRRWIVQADKLSRVNMNCTGYGKRTIENMFFNLCV